MPLHQIKHRHSGSVLFKRDCSNMKLCVEAAVEEGINLSGAYLNDADLRKANLRDADLDGADLRVTDLRDADLQGANLRGADLSFAELSRARLTGADLYDADLQGAELQGVDLQGAVLRDADFQGAKGLPPIPVVKNIDDVILAALDKGGILDMTTWHGPDKHWCGTTHCMAGWAIHEAGKAGRALEERVGPAVAGALIFAASRADNSVPDFYGSNKEALADLKAHAAQP